MSWFTSLCTLLTPFQRTGDRRLPSLHGQPWSGRALGERSITHSSLSSSPVTCSSHTWQRCVALVPRLPSGREDLYQLPWLYQMVQMALPLLCVAAFYCPTQLQKTLFSFVLSRLKKNTNPHFQEQISSLLTQAIQMHISDIKNQTLPSSPRCCSSLWDKLGVKMWKSS